MKNILLAVTIGGMLVGCASINRNDGGNANLKARVVKDIIHLKYEVGAERVKGVDQVNSLFGLVCWGSTAHTCDQGDSGFGVRAVARNGAYANACDAANCDQLVGARYSVFTDDYLIFKRVKAEVSGFPARAVSAQVLDGTGFPAEAED